MLLICDGNQNDSDSFFGARQQIPIETLRSKLLVRVADPGRAGMTERGEGAIDACSESVKLGKDFRVEILAADQCFGAGNEIELEIGDLLLGDPELFGYFLVANADDKQ